MPILVHFKAKNNDNSYFYKNSGLSFQWVPYYVYIGFYAYAIIGHTWANQLLPQLLMEHFDTLPIQCRHIEHMHEGVYFRKNIF